MTAEFLITVLVIELTPGPTMITLATVSAAQGRAAGLAAVAGVAAGLSLYLVLTTLGFGVAFAAAPGLLRLLSWAGVAYLFWLGLEALRSAETPVAPDPRAPFLQGFLANALNAKSLVFYTALLPSFLDPNAPPLWSQALALGFVHIAVATTVHIVVALGAARAASVAGFGMRSRATSWAFALSLWAVAFWLAVRELSAA